jgi:hypothetical protein
MIKKGRLLPRFVIVTGIAILSRPFRRKAVYIILLVTTNTRRVCAKKSSITAKNWLFRPFLGVTLNTINASMTAVQGESCASVIKSLLLK